MSKIGLVTVLYKSDEVLDGFFRTVSLQDYKDYCLYLIDNSVNDKTDTLIESLIKKFPVTAYKHIKNSDNIGVAAGNNAGIKIALSEGCSHILLLNNDIEIPQSFLFSNLVQISENKDESLIVPKIFYYPDKKIWMAGGYIDKLRALGVHYGYNKNDAPKYNIPMHVSYAPTCFMLIRKEVFEKVGMIDEKYFAYYDDTDFVFRAGLAGYKIYYEPSLYILHKVSSIAGTESLFYVYYSNRNKIYFIRKNFRGFFKYFSLTYTLTSRVAFWLKYDKERKKKLIKGLRDGCKIPISK
ncbi:MAG TPA: glycosyltransferase family 2 protein [Chitinophagaceae bacterium]|nr:glycosyltransferase family 2 protein [Chitinophagaceae bacterium]